MTASSLYASSFTNSLYSSFGGNSHVGNPASGLNEGSNHSTNSNVSGNSATNDHSYHRSLSTRGTNSPGMTYGGGVYRHFLPQAAMALAEPSSPPIPSTDSYNGNGSPTGPSIADIDEHDDDKSAKASMNFTPPRVRTSANADDLEAVGSVLDQTSFPEEEDDDADDGMDNDNGDQR